MKRFQNISFRGFTLIELLVTIAIIGVLTSVIAVNLNGFRQRSRDAQRKKEVALMQTALELYRADVGRYPQTGTGEWPACGNPLQNGSTVYMQEVPCGLHQPLQWQANLSYYGYNSNGTTYLLFACLENANDPDRDNPTLSGACSHTGTSYTVRSP